MLRRQFRDDNRALKLRATHTFIPADFNVSKETNFDDLP